MKLDFRHLLRADRAVDSSLGLAVVDGGADVVDGQLPVGGYEARELQHLVEVPLCGQRNCNHSNLSFFHGELVIFEFVKTS